MPPDTVLWPEGNFVTMDESLDAWERFVNA